MTKKNEVQAVEVQAEVVAQPVVESQQLTKAAIGRKVFDEMHKDGAVPKRGDVIKMIMKQANISEKGAATYYQNTKKARGLVKPKVAA